VKPWNNDRIEKKKSSASLSPRSMKNAVQVKPLSKHRRTSTLRIMSFGNSRSIIAIVIETVLCFRRVSVSSVSIVKCSLSRSRCACIIPLVVVVQHVNKGPSWHVVPCRSFARMHRRTRPEHRTPAISSHHGQRNVYLPMYPGFPNDSTRSHLSANLSSDLRSCSLSFMM
jgi:hypothetical protein